jgi:hypothetical protein
MAEESGIDLKSRVGYRHSRGWKGMAHELGPGHLCASDGFSPTAGVLPVCRALSRRLQGPEFLLGGSVSLRGLRATYRVRKFARHRRNAAGSGRVANSYKPVERIARIIGHDPADSGALASSKPLKVWPTLPKSPKPAPPKGLPPDLPPASSKPLKPALQRACHPPLEKP